MKRRVLLLSPAIIAAASAAHATVFLTTAQAQAMMFPGETLQPSFLKLTAEQQSAIRRDSGESPLSDELKAWRVSGGGWFIVDEVVGKHEYITFALSLDATGGVKDVEVLDYRETYGYEIREAAWRAQFTGKHHGAKLKLGDDIRNISGATLSCKHITDGVRRLLATYAIVLARG
jgi:hypothetical protein